MDLRQIPDQQKEEYNKLASHVMQSWQWGEFRKSIGTQVLRFGLYEKDKLVEVFQLTFHKIPKIPFFVGYLPKGPFPDQKLAEALTKVGKERSCAFIKVEPNILKSNTKDQISKINKRFTPSPKPLFTQYNYVLDLTKPDEEILKNMHPKFRYNIKVAQKHKVTVEIRDDDEALKIYLDLYFATTNRQNYQGHNRNYHKAVWKTLKKAGMARILIASYQPPDTKEQIPLASWMLLNFKDTLYYPYGGSSHQYKNVMASNLIAWEAIKYGKKIGCSKFDLWGAVGPDTPQNHPWQGFHRFKTQLGSPLIEYIDTYDLIFNWPIYQVFTLIDRLMPLKIFLLKLLRQ